MNVLGPPCMEYILHAVSLMFVRICIYILYIYIFSMYMHIRTNKYSVCIYIFTQTSKTQRVVCMDHWIGTTG